MRVQDTAALDDAVEYVVRRAGDVVTASGGSAAVPTRLSCSPYDPYAVEVAFRFGQAYPVTWVFARELPA